MANIGKSRFSSYKEFPKKYFIIPSQPSPPILTSTWHLGSLTPPASLLAVAICAHERPIPKSSRCVDVRCCLSNFHHQSLFNPRNRYPLLNPSLCIRDSMQKLLSLAEMLKGLRVRDKKVVIFLFEKKIDEIPI